MRPTALVTGGGSGIGRAIVEALSHDAWVAALDRRFDDAPPGSSLAVTADVSHPNAVRDAVGQVVEARGGIDWVVCAAGITRDRVSWKMSEPEWREVIDVNLTGAFLTVQSATPSLRQSNGGRCLLISSINGIRGRFGQANYAASKAGLIGLGRSLALELARDGVTVNVIAPGFIDMPMTRGLPEDMQRRAVERTPLHRKGHPEDIAAAVRFLCSAAAGFITGTVLPIDGGQLLGGL